MSKEAFKSFVRLNPSLASFVNDNSMTWQKFYEMFELYGTDNAVWNEFLTRSSGVSMSSAENTFKELVSMAKGINLDKVQKGIENVQKTISLIQDFGTNNVTSNYEKRPVFRKFDD